MTLGEKTKLARQRLGISQEQLAEKLCVSRSAIAKWETDKGLPDVGNLKQLAQLLQVTVDHLLDENQAAPTSYREPCDLSLYGPGCDRLKKDRLMRSRFSGAKIYPLMGRAQSPAPAVPAGNRCGAEGLFPGRSSRQFYLVEQTNDRLFVAVSDRDLEIHPLAAESDPAEFSLDGWRYVLCNYEISD